MFSGQKKLRVKRSSMSFNYHRKNHKYDKTFKNIKRSWNFTPYTLDSNQPTCQCQRVKDLLVQSPPIHVSKSTSTLGVVSVQISIGTFSSHYILGSRLQKHFVSVDKKSLLMDADSDLIPLPATRIYYFSVLQNKNLKGQNSSNNCLKMTGVFHPLTSV